MWRRPLAARRPTRNRPWRFGPVCLYPDTRTRMMPVLRPADVVAEVPLLQRAGPEVLHDDVGALDEIEEQIAALGLAQVSVTAFLLRACTVQKKWWPSSSAWPHVRSGSGAPGGSILMTSAPMSPSNRPANGRDQRADLDHPMPSSGPVTVTVGGAWPGSQSVQTLTAWRSVSRWARLEVVVVSCWGLACTAI